jgi:hypothetical protein
MGDANAEDIVDEKQWDKDEEESENGDDKDGGGKDEEKFEKDSKMKGEALDGEMRTKEDGDEDENEKVRCALFMTVLLLFNASLESRFIWIYLFF